jgi:hypothetical protein
MAKSKSDNRGLSPWQNDQSKPSQSGFRNAPSNISRPIDFMTLILGAGKAWEEARRKQRDFEAAIKEAANGGNFTPRPACGFSNPGIQRVRSAGIRMFVF